MANEHVLRIKAVLDTTQLQAELNKIKMPAVNGRINAPINAAGAGFSNTSPVYNNVAAAQTSTSLHSSTYAQATNMVGAELVRAAGYLTQFAELLGKFAENIQVSSLILKEGGKIYSSTFGLINKNIKDTNPNLLLINKEFAVLSDNSTTLVENLQKLGKAITDTTRSTANSTQATQTNTSVKNANTQATKTETSAEKISEIVKREVASATKQLQADLEIAQKEIRELKDTIAQLNNTANITTNNVQSKNAYHTSMGVSMGLFGLSMLAQQFIPGTSGKNGLTKGGLIGDVTNGAISGAASGALTGSMFGPIGTAVGAAVGGFVGGLGSATTAVQKFKEALEETIEKTSDSIEDYKKQKDRREEIEKMEKVLKSGNAEEIQKLIEELAKNRKTAERNSEHTDGVIGIIEQENAALDANRPPDSFWSWEALDKYVNPTSSWENGVTFLNPIAGLIAGYLKYGWDTADAKEDAVAISEWNDETQERQEDNQYTIDLAERFIPMAEAALAEINEEKEKEEELRALGESTLLFQNLVKKVNELGAKFDLEGLLKFKENFEELSNSDEFRDEGLRRSKYNLAELPNFNAFLANTIAIAQKERANWEAYDRNTTINDLVGRKDVGALQSMLDDFKQQRQQYYRVDYEKFESFSPIINTLERAIQGIKNDTSFKKLSLDPLSDLSKYGISSARGEMQTALQSLNYQKQIAKNVDRIAKGEFVGVYA